MAPRLKLVAHPAVAQDLKALPSQELILLALSRMKAIRDGKIKGQSLENRTSTGDLSDCFKILFDTRKDLPPRFRIVYRNLSNGVEVIAVEILSVGERFDLEAYLEAASRLGRIPRTREKN